MNESISIQFLFDVKYHEAVMELITSVNETECQVGAFITEGSYATYDPVQRRLLLHLFEFINMLPTHDEYPRPENLFDRFAQATDGTGLAWYNTIHRR